MMKGYAPLRVVRLKFRNASFWTTLTNISRRGLIRRRLINGTWHYNLEDCRNYVATHPKVQS